MTSILSALLGGLGLGKLQAFALAALLAACGTLWLLYDGAIAKRDAAQLARDQALAINADNLQALDAMTADHAREIAALSRERNAAIARGERTRVITRRVMDAPKTDACANSPAVRAYFGELRRQGSSSSDPDGAASR